MAYKLVKRSGKALSGRKFRLVKPKNGRTRGTKLV
jgi:hypothetical protein